MLDFQFLLKDNNRPKDSDIPNRLISNLNGFIFKAGFEVFLPVPANHRGISVLKVALVTFEINLEMVLLHVAPEVAVTSHFLAAIGAL